MGKDRKVQAGCVNASNPFHECADYCNQRSSNSNLKIRGAKSPVHNGISNASKGDNVDPNCVNASNPFHQCAEYCTKRKLSDTGKSGHFASVFSSKSSSSGRSDGAKSGSFVFPVLKLSPRSSPAKSSGQDKQVQNGVNPNCVNASNPFHRCADYCSKTSEDVVHETTIGKSAVQNGELMGDKAIKSDDITSETEMQTTAITLAVQNGELMGDKAIKSDDITSETEMQSAGITLGDLISKEKRMEGSTNEVNKRRQTVTKVDPRCPDASNPFHECAEYCQQKIIRSGRSEGPESDRSKGSVKSAADNNDVDPRCPNASNPFHKCADYCFEKIRQST